MTIGRLCLLMGVTAFYTEAMKGGATDGEGIDLLSRRNILLCGDV